MLSSFVGKDSAKGPECLEHAMDCLVRLVRALLGDDAIANHKIEWGAELVVLGMLVSPCSEG